MAYEIPNSLFNIIEAYSPIENIYLLTNEFNNISQKTERDLLRRLCHRKKPTIFGSFKAPVKAIAYKVNGERGYFLQKTTDETDVDLIWYDDKNEEYLFWGSSKYKVSDAMKHIRSRIIKYVIHVKTDETAEPINTAKPINTAEPINTAKHTKPVKTAKHTFTRYTIADSPPPREE
jgi:hypothetical protein